MASLGRSRYGVYHLTFSYGGRRFHRSLQTKNEAEARTAKRAVEASLARVRSGILPIPPQVTADQFWRLLLVGQAVPASLPKVTNRVTVAAVADEYLHSYSATSKEASTLETEKHHLNHFKRVLGESTSLSEITAASLRAYVRTREHEPGTHGRTVSAVTISKELATFRQLWEFAQNEGLIVAENPLRHVRKPRPAQRPRFMTRAEIERTIQRGGLSDADIAGLWECMFLSEQEIAEFLTHVKRTAPQYPRFFYIYPALTFCAFTGCRRSEMFRAQIADIDGQTIQIREKKRSQRETFTFRQVPKHPELAAVLADWLSSHPGGQLLFAKSNLKPLDDKTSREAFEAVTRKCKWEVLRGYHILRHSFCSNLARHGVDQRVIDAFMGHQTEASRQRYRHLFPDDSSHAIELLDYRTAESDQQQDDPPNFRIVG